jgi:hypothetical protein
MHISQLASRVKEVGGGGGYQMMPSAAPTCHRGREIAQASKNSVNFVILPHCCVYSHSIELILVVIQSVATVIVCSILSTHKIFFEQKIMHKNKNKNVAILLSH